MASSGAYLILAVIYFACANAAPTGQAITAADIPATPGAATCKANLDAAMTQFSAGGIAAVTQVAGATPSNYIFCLEYKPTAEATAKIVLHIEPSYLAPIGTLSASPATPQIAGESMVHLTPQFISPLPIGLYGTGTTTFEPLLFLLHKIEDSCAFYGTTFQQWSLTSPSVLRFLWLCGADHDVDAGSAYCLEHALPSGW
jgi:hypothetical protein